MQLSCILLEYRYLSYISIPMQCKRFKSEAHYKNWLIRWIQRYKCKECWYSYTNTQDRKAPIKIKLQALQLYTLWLWFRAIAKFLKYSHVAVYQRIKEFGILADQIHQENKHEWKIIEYIELDELRHFVQKKRNNFEYGRLSIDWTTNLLILPSETVAKKLESDYGRS